MWSLHSAICSDTQALCVEVVEGGGAGGLHLFFFSSSGFAGSVEEEGLEYSNLGRVGQQPFHFLRDKNNPPPACSVSLQKRTVALTGGARITHLLGWKILEFFACGSCFYNCT